MARPKKNTSPEPEIDIGSVFGDLNDDTLLPTSDDFEAQPTEPTEATEPAQQPTETRQEPQPQAQVDLDTPVPEYKNPNTVSGVSGGSLSAIGIKRIQEAWEENGIVSENDEIPHRMSKYALNAKPGVRFTEYDPSEVVNQPKQFVTKKYKMVSAGLHLDGELIDTATDAQEPPKPYDPHDKQHFIACVNKECYLRETCLRYRMKNKVPNKLPFYQEDCMNVETSMYIDVRDYPDFTAYDPIHVLEDDFVPKRLPEPEQ